MVGEALAAACLDAATYVVWVPMLRAEGRHVARATRVLGAGRAAHYWDGHGILVSGFQAALLIAEPAWDIYMVFAPGIRWDRDEPPEPSFWMHQLGRRVEGPRLDAETLVERAQLLVKGSP